MIVVGGHGRCEEAHDIPTQLNAPQAQNEVLNKEEYAHLYLGLRVLLLAMRRKNEL